MKALVLCLFVLLGACGRAQFSGRTQATTSVNVPLLLVNTDYYVEIGQQFSSELAGQVDIENVVLSGEATWSGSSNMQLEMRMSLAGTAAANEVVIRGTTAPAAWSTATVVFDQNVSGFGITNQLLSANIRDVASSALAQQKFWLIARLRSQGTDIAEVLNLSNVQAYAEGTKSLAPLSPVINLGF